MPGVITGYFFECSNYAKFQNYKYVRFNTHFYVVFMPSQIHCVIWLFFVAVLLMGDGYDSLVRLSP